MYMYTYVHFSYIGSGKTFTMDGSNENPGIIQRTILELFDITSRSHGAVHTFVITMLEIYNETIRDLLLPSKSQQIDQKLDVRHNSEGSNVSGLTEVEVCAAVQVFEVLERGRVNRAVGSHDMNEHSSRSHSILTILCKGKNMIDGKSTFGKLNLIDLAGSER